jgi:hypothetical protein
VSYKYHWANPVQTSGWQNYPNGFVYTNGIGMPTPRLDWYGNRPIRIHSFGDYYVSGAGSFMRMNYYGNLLDTGGVMHVNTIGGTFQWEAHQGNVSNQMFFGRDPGCCTVTSANDGFVWAGMLAGSFWWDQVPSNPGISVWSVGRSAHVLVTPPGDDGGTGVDQYTVQYSKDGGGWTGDRYGGSTVYDNLLPGTYTFRTWCHNAVGYSPATYSSALVIKAGGKRYNGTSFNPTTIARRWNGSAWVDLTTAKRWNGSAWVDLS